MGQTLDTLRAIRDDLASSWYFRIWLLMWIVCAITVFVCLGFVGHRANEERREPSYRIWLQRASDIHYPDFQIRTGDASNHLARFECTTDKGTSVTSRDCPTTAGDTRWCKIVFAGGFKNTNGRIVCNITTTPSVNTDQLLAWEAVNASTDFTPIPDTNIWFGPNHMAWVILNKEVESKDGHWHSVFHPTLLYHSTIWESGFYSVSTLFSSTKVIHYDVADWYNGWEALGIIGGYTFSLYILHTIAMIVVGVVVSNNSIFLGGNAGKAGYSSNL